MILIVVKFETKPEYTDTFPELVRDFTEATRAEPGNKWFEWNRSLEEPNVFTLVEAFDDDGAAAHVNSDHFKQAMVHMKPLLATTPHIISRTVEGDGWDRMGELRVD
ncbi:antibiotic biosynthesis monooxygenase [Pseudoclavibacter endophyticus]|uniref:Antibiotic biosynthesis monooxygenase n=1 Tax=Pseudoclavibacter endophyticus TaxID=1778590 RepID=A0A6H9WGG2_9MICO|nr:putative quinol monooxygenase [Pseudoclavibacter endophyticus]KAB1650012.1 antibiotic biosynthesis monooxygenase [Pseudoclavibacter endophyticus]GGA57984.1 antibiotic biosynthesis monooxygenase [Pseudoclavibacter endophyticus]